MCKKSTSKKLKTEKEHVRLVLLRLFCCMDNRIGWKKRSKKGRRKSWSDEPKPHWVLVIFNQKNTFLSDSGLKKWAVFARKEYRESQSIFVHGVLGFFFGGERIIDRTWRNHINNPFMVLNSMVCLNTS